MAELEKCPNCREMVNMETEIFRRDGFICCEKCGERIDFE